MAADNIKCANVVSHDSAEESAPRVEQILKLLSGAVQRQSDEQLMQLQALLNAVCEQLINSLTEPISDRVEPLLAELRRTASLLAGGLQEFQRDSSYYLGYVHAIAQAAEMVRHQKIPRPAAAILINHRDALPIAQIVFESGSIGLSQLAIELHKQSQNLLGILRDMQTAGLLRRDEFGRNVVFSPTPLTRAAVEWGLVEKAIAA